MITFEDIKNNMEINTYIIKADEVLDAIGFTEHSFAHVTHTAMRAGNILKVLNYPERMQELSKIAGYMHDMGNIINRHDHAQSGAYMAFHILTKMGMHPEEIATIIAAIGNHDEGTATPVNAVVSALILADKTDVRRSRVKQKDLAQFDIHDRVNYAVEAAETYFNSEHTEFTLDLVIDTSLTSVMSYFEIFLERMILCTKAAEKLNIKFALIINQQKLL